MRRIGKSQMSNARNDELVRLRLKGWKLRALAERFGISKQRVHQLASKMLGVNAQAAALVRLKQLHQQKRIRQAILWLRQRNPTAPMDFIADVVGMPCATIRKWPEAHALAPLWPAGLAEATVVRVINLRQRGLQQTKIAALTGLRQQEVSKVLVRAGLRSVRAGNWKRTHGARREVEFCSRLRC